LSGVLQDSPEQSDFTRMTMTLLPVRALRLETLTSNSFGGRLRAELSMSGAVVAGRTNSTPQSSGNY